MTDFALVFLLPCVGDLVFLQVRGLGELLAANVAGVRVLASVQRL